MLERIIINIILRYHQGFSNRFGFQKWRSTVYAILSITKTAITDIVCAAIVGFADDTHRRCGGADELQETKIDSPHN